MNTIFPKRAFLLVASAALATFYSAISAQAETLSPATVETNTTLTSSQALDASMAQGDLVFTTARDTTLTPMTQVEDSQLVAPEDLAVVSEQPEASMAPTELSQTELDSNPEMVTVGLASEAPVLRSAVELTDSPAVSQTTPFSEAEALPAAPQEVAQTVVRPGRATRSGSSYIGIGGNIGLGEGDTALGEASFAVISKIGLTNRFSVRPSLLLEDDVTILVPVTVDFTRRGVEVTDDVGFRAAPYVGAGVAISTADDTTFDLLLSGGVDVPVSPNLTATAAINATIFDNAAVGLLLGIGYNFAGF